MSRGAGGDPARRLDAWLDAAVRRNAFPGAVALVDPGRGDPTTLRTGRTGSEDVDVPVASETPYDLASLTKPLATAALAVLAEQDGRVDLDARVATLVPEVSGTPYADATFVDLGTHRAGLPAWAPLYLEADDAGSTVRAIVAKNPNAAAGETVYSDLGYVLLGVALERVFDARLDASFRERIARPLGLEGEIGFAPAGTPWRGAAPTERGNAYERRLAEARGLPVGSYPFRDRVLRGEVHDGNAWALGGVAGHAGLFGTARAVARVAGALASDGGPLGARARARLLEPDGDAGPRTFGYVTAAASGAARGTFPDRAPGHVGFTGTSVWLDPAARRIAVLLTNRVHPAVRDIDFQAERRAFHALAVELE